MESHAGADVLSAACAGTHTAADVWVPFMSPLGSWTGAREEWHWLCEHPAASQG